MNRNLGTRNQQSGLGIQRYSAGAYRPGLRFTARDREKEETSRIGPGRQSSRRCQREEDRRRAEATAPVVYRTPRVRGALCAFQAKKIDDKNLGSENLGRSARNVSRYYVPDTRRLKIQPDR